MKILNIRIKNLNSLKGEFNINFQEYPLKNSGLFLIAGRTGAGKTTILDAITLALYGEAPRFDDHKGKSTHEMMSHGTKEAAAELTFETDAGIFIANWKLRKTRTGRLDKVKRELMQVLEGEQEPKLLAHKITEVNAMVEDIMGGLNYNRFKRSIMLAQGDFAQFLKGTEDRSDILERITNTELYTKISKHAHLKNKEEAEKLKELHQLVKHVDLLSQEEVKHIETELMQYELDYSSANHQLELVNEGLDWHRKNEDLQLKLSQAKHSLTTLKAKDEAMKADNHRLSLHQQAQPLQNQVFSYDRLKVESFQLETQLNNYVLKKQGLEEGLTQAEAKHQQQRILLENLHQEQLAQEPVWDQVLALDLKIEGQQKYVEGLKEKLEASRVTHGQLNASVMASSNAYSDNATRLQAGREWLSNHEVDVQLIEGDYLLQLNQLKVEWEQLTIQLEEKKSTKAGIHEKLEQLRKEHLKLQEQTADLDKQQLGFKKQQEALIQQELTQYKGEDIHDMLHYIQEELDEQMLQFQAMHELNQLLKKRAKALNELDRIGEEKSAANIALENYDYYYLQLDLQKIQLKEEIDYQQKLCARLQVNMSLEEHRHLLKEGEACPLCLSLDHPIRQEENVVFDSQFEREQKKLKKLMNALEQLELQLSDLFKEITQAFSATKHYDKQDKALNGDLDEIQDETQDLYDKYQQLDRSLLDHDEEEMGQALEAYSRANLSLNTAKNQLEKWQKAKEANELQLAKLQERIKLNEEQKTEREQLLERVFAEEKSLNHKEKAYLKQGRQLLTKFEVELSDMSMMTAHIKTLEQRKKTYENGLKKVQELELSLKQLEHQLKVEKAQLSEKNAELTEKNQELILNKETLEAYLFNRAELFGDKDPRQEQQILKNKLQACNKEDQQLFETKNQYQSDLKATSDLIKEQEKIFNNKKEALNLAHKALLIQTQKAGFDQLEALRKAMLEPADAARLQKAVDDLNKAVEKQVELMEDLGQQLEKLHSDKPALEKEKTADELKREKEQLKVQCEELQQTIGKHKLKLEDHEKKMATQQELMQQVKHQEKECQKWEAMYQLIGHAEGKKFRQFAQNITLTRLVQLANKHLQQFVSGRYLLEKRGDDSLEIDIIDRFQANNKRALNTLSGGETFLASLSLALGLSDLASGKAQLESLFIDEGFGTLDPDTLAVALRALQSLQAQGKTIGIISHVQQLKNKIDVQIQVNKRTTGFSKIEMIGG